MSSPPPVLPPLPVWIIPGTLTTLTLYATGVLLYGDTPPAGVSLVLHGLKALSVAGFSVTLTQAVARILYRPRA